MTFATILLQALPEQAVTATGSNISIFALLAKGGWVMAPLAILFALMIFFISDSWAKFHRLENADRNWLPETLGRAREGAWEEAYNIAKRAGSPLSRVIRTGIQSRNLPKEQIEEDMQMEARQSIARIEGPVGYLGMIASVAPMLGFLGTIFGVITIFMNISATNEFSISSISDGLYQKMICSGAGLLEGVISYCAYWLLNRRVDRMVLTMDKGANALLKIIAANRAQ